MLTAEAALAQDFKSQAATANMVLIALTAIGITLVIERDIRRRLVPSGRPEYGVLIASAILSMAIGFYSPDSAMYAYFLNLASPLVLISGS